MRAAAGVTLAMVLIANPAAAPAEGGEGSSALRSAWRFFSWSTGVPVALHEALAALDNGRSFEALAGVTRLLETEGESRFADDALLVRALALDDLGWDELAASAYEALLDLEPVSPYFPLALLGAVEARARSDGPEAVVALWERHFESAWKDGDGREREIRRIRGLFEAFGSLRQPGSPLSRDERDLLASPGRLAEALRDSRDRVTERLAYLAGQALFRVGRYEESVQALGRLGVASPYSRYGLYTTSQALHALGQDREALAALRRLFVYPVMRAEESALAGRAGVLRARVLFERGTVDEALRAAGRVPGDGFYALQGRLLRGDICLATERPGLAVTYYREMSTDVLTPALEAGRALGLGAAYTALGDYEGAAHELREAVGRVSAAGRANVGEDDAATRLSSLADRGARQSRDVRRERQRFVAAGVRRIVEVEGPMNLRRLVRTIFMSHRNTVIGSPLHDIEALASGWPAAAPDPISLDALWLDFLGAGERSGVERLLARRFDLETAEDPAETGTAFRTVDVLLEEAASPEAGASRLLGELRRAGVEVGARGPADRSPGAWRRAVAATWTGAPERLPDDVAAVVRRERQRAIGALSARASEALEQFLERRDAGFLRMQYDLEAALSLALARQSGALGPEGGGTP